MHHAEQVKLLQGLLDQLDRDTNVDAGRQFKNPVASYTSEQLGTLEWQRFFLNYPQVIGLSPELAEPNTFFTSNTLDKPILCTRDNMGKFRAFLNACQHRGTIVATEKRGKKAVFSCPFHAWSYSASGHLVSVPKEEHFGQVDKSCHSLTELPAIEAHGILWVHPDPAGSIDIDELLDEELCAEFTSWNLANNIFQSEVVYDHAMNWKLAIDTFGETYHFNTLHKDTLAHDFYGNMQMYNAFKRNHRMLLCLKNIDTLRNIPKAEWHVLQGALPVYYLFPNTQLILGLGGPTLVRVYPRGPNPHNSYSEVTFYLRPEVEQITDERVRTEIADRMLGFGEVIRDKDYIVSASSHRGLASGAMEYLIFGRNKPALHHYHNTYRELLGMAPLQEV